METCNQLTVPAASFAAKNGSFESWLLRRSLEAAILFMALAFRVQTISAQETLGWMPKEEVSSVVSYDHPGHTTVTNLSSRLYLKRAAGRLKIKSPATTDTYEVYFHVPVPFEDQVPILLQIDCPEMTDYRFLHLTGRNILAAARLNNAPSAELVWTSWVLIREQSYTNIPLDAIVPTPDQLPDSVKPWLQPTDCVQINVPFIQNKARSVKDGTMNLKQLADSIAEYCSRIPARLPHDPFSLDAYYALRWGSSCTGHAHAGAALFRANGVPARVLLNMPSWATLPMDMHWIIDYFIPDYGWVKMETVLGENPYPSQDLVVVLACNPEDEFPVFYPSGIENQWHTSDPALGMYAPDWGGAHRAFDDRIVSAGKDTIDDAFSLTDLVFSCYSDFCGIALDSSQQRIVNKAYQYQQSAVAVLRLGDIDAYMDNMRRALDCYRSITLAPITTYFEDDFEKGPNGWTHGDMDGAGQTDEWTLGTPAYGPAQAHSGKKCWRSAFGAEYRNNSNTWLLSPEIDLSDAACAYLSFWLWNSVQDMNQGFVYDPLWLDITTDGSTFQPLSSEMGGVNDDPIIPSIGGWTKIVLDLTKYGGKKVRIRFRFKSDGSIAKPGSYIDDFSVFGRRGRPSGISPSPLPAAFALEQNFPNPFNPVTVIRYSVPARIRTATPAASSHVILKVYDVLGREVKTLVDEKKPAGNYNVVFNASNLPSGVYFYRLQAGDFSRTRKLILLK